MSIYNTNTIIPPIIPPRIDLDLNDATFSGDDRIKIAEVEAAFEEFESELSMQLHRQISPIGKRLANVPSGLDELVSTTGSNLHRHGISRGALPSPMYSLTDGLHLDGELHDFDLSSMTTVGSRSSGGRFPRRVGGARLPTYTPSAPALNRNASFPTGTSVDPISTLLGDLATNSSAESRVTVSLRDPSIHGSSAVATQQVVPSSESHEPRDDTEVSCT